VWCWGQNGQGQIAADDLGAGDTAPCTQGAACDYAVPTQVPGTFDDVVAGDDFTCAFASGDASIHCWGRFADGGLGVAGAASHRDDERRRPDRRLEPRPVGRHHRRRPRGVRADRDRRSTGVLGTPPGGATGVTQATPKPLGTDANGARLFVFADDSGMGHERGMRVVWAANDVDQLGTQFTYATPNKLATDTDTMALAVAGKHGCKLTTAAGVVCFGSNTYGESGLPANNPANTDPMGAPNTIASLSSCSGVSVAGDHSCALCGTTCHAGARTSRACSGAAPTRPTRRSRPSRSASRTRRPSRPPQTGGCALDAGHALWCWGLGDRGELANGGRDLSLPTSIAIP